METTPIPAPWKTFASPAIPYWRSLDFLEREWDRTTAFGDEPPETDMAQEYFCWRRVSIVWACAFIEAIINEEGAMWLGNEFYKDNVERLDPTVRKMRLLYALKYRQMIAKDAVELKEIHSLFEWRNQLIHPKASFIKDDGSFNEPQFDLRELKFSRLRDACRTAVAMFQTKGDGEPEAKDL